MIWFACAQCGKQHGRDESAIGSVIFCDCGFGNRVPWESTTTAPDPGAVPAVVLPPLPPPRLEPIPVGEERLPTAQPARRSRGRRRDPAFCFNHANLPAESGCDACAERFCNHCLARIADRTLCGPCKNFTFRNLGKPPRVCGLALAAVIVALVCAGLLPLILLMVMAAGSILSAWPAVALVVLPQMLAALLAALALYKTAANPKLGGQALAVTALVTAGTAALVLGALTFMSFVQWV